jgi:hypothetical protein
MLLVCLSGAFVFSPFGFQCIKGSKTPEKPLTYHPDLFGELPPEWKDEISQIRAAAVLLVCLSGTVA